MQWPGRLSAALFWTALTVFAQDPLRPAPGRFSLLLFVLGDCPISRRLGPEMGRICAEYRDRGVDCTLVYVDPETTPAAARRHAADFSLGGLPFAVDSRHRLVKAAGATVTPEAALQDSAGRLLYRGRIDDSHASWTRSRPAVKRDLREALDAVLAGKPVPNPRTPPVGCYISPLNAKD